MTGPLIQKGASDDTLIRARGCLLLGGKYALKMTACLVSINPASAMGVGLGAWPALESPQAVVTGTRVVASAGRGIISRDAEKEHEGRPGLISQDLQKR